MNAMKTKSRWEIAQQYEKEWWDTRREHIDCDFYRAYAQELERQLAGILAIQEETPILEIGSGAAGIITFLPSEIKCAIDPLEYFYGSVPGFVKARDSRVEYHTAKAEALPFENNRFRMIIMDNVLDHCDDLNSIFAEMSRVLQGAGIVYLRLNVYTFWGKFVRKLVEKLKIDPGHPYTFTIRSLRSIVEDHQFDMIKMEEPGFWRTWRKELRSLKPKEWLKAVTFSTPNKVTFILRLVER